MDALSVTYGRLEVHDKSDMNMIDTMKEFDSSLAAIAMVTTGGYTASFCSALCPVLHTILLATHCHPVFVCIATTHYIGINF